MGLLKFYFLSFLMTLNSSKVFHHGIHQQHRNLSNRIDVRIIEKETQTVKIIEMSCPWIENRKQKNQEKTTKYAPLGWELKQQHRGYTIKQYNIIIGVLGGYSSETRENVILLLGKTKADRTLFNMQKAVISSTLNTTRSFKVLS